MTPEEAIAKAKAHVNGVFSGEGIFNLGLEELRFDGGYWNVTVGFSRPWDKPKLGTLSSLANAPPTLARTYKLVRIYDQTGEVMEIVNRSLAA